MSTIRITQITNGQNIFWYKVCGLKIITNKKLNSLSIFENTDNSCSKDSLETIIPSINKGQMIFEGSSWLAEENREISCSNTDQGYLISVPEISKFMVSHDGSNIVQIPSSSQEKNLRIEHFENTLLGPPLILALAMNGFFGLHASSVEIDSKAILFTGESGFGKSTMARYLQREAGFKRLSDDISVISAINSDFLLNCDFPQLKLADNLQTNQNDNRKLGAVVVLNRHEGRKEAQLTKLDNINAIKVLLNHGVAAQLFDKPLANQHLSFMADLVENISVYKLDYPNGLDQIKSVAKLLSHEID